LFVVEEGKSLYIRIRVQHGDDLFLLSKRFKAPPAKVASLNGLTYQSGLRRGSSVKIPVGKYNYVSINSAVSTLPLYYKVKEGESLRQVSRKFNVPQSSVQRWNGLSEPEVETGQILQTGWIKYDSGQVAFPDHPEPEDDSLSILPKSGPAKKGDVVTKDSLRTKKSLLSAVDSLND